ncbi:MAG: hypothetical protein C5B51_01650 [Terriglobia bacterium]|nr:MAG: hypothetical protein C5B51_01650 [Terriglobia bacterium]
MQHATGRPYHCPECRRGFRSYASLRRHMDTDHTRPRQCPNCGKPLREGEYHRC